MSRRIVQPDDGALTFAAESALPGSPTYFYRSSWSFCLFVGSYNAGNVSVTRLQDGLPVELAGCGGRAGRLPLANITPDNRTLWVPALKQIAFVCLR